MITSIHIEYQTAGRWRVTIEDHKGRFTREIAGQPWTGAVCLLINKLIEMVEKNGTATTDNGEIKHPEG